MNTNGNGHEWRNEPVTDLFPKLGYEVWSELQSEGVWDSIRTKGELVAWLDMRLKDIPSRLRDEFIVRRFNEQTAPKIGAVREEDRRWINVPCDRAPGGMIRFVNDYVKLQNYRLVRICFKPFFEALDPSYAIDPVENWARRDEYEQMMLSGRDIKAPIVHATVDDRMEIQFFGLAIAQIKFSRHGQCHFSDKKFLFPGISLHLRPKLRTSFTDGRHRLAMLRHLGAPWCPVCVDERYAGILLERCGWNGGSDS